MLLLLLILLLLLMCYRQVITDLLQPSNDDLAVKLHPRRGFSAAGLTRQIVDTPFEALKAIQTGKRNRRAQKLAAGQAQHSTVGLAY